MNSARPSSSLLASSSAASWPSRRICLGIEPTFSKAASIRSSRRVARAPPMQKRSTSALRQFSSWNGARHTSIPETRWPIRCEISFTFYNDALYQVIVNYDRDRTEGLTNSDIVESLSAAYGVPTLASARTRTSPPAEAFPDSIVLARWENAESLLTLLRGVDTPEFQLILISKPLSTRARSAVREAIRLDAIEAPRREAEQRKKEAGDASAARDKTRITNKAAFRP